MRVSPIYGKLNSAAPETLAIFSRSDATLAPASEGGSRAAGGKAALSAAERDARERSHGASTATD